MSYRKRYGGKYKHYLNLFIRNKNLSLRQLEEIQNLKLKNFLAHTLKESSYFNKLYCNKINRNNFGLNDFAIQKKESFLQKVKKLNSIITDDSVFFEGWEKYVKSQENFYLSSLYIKNFYLRAFFMKGILPASLLKTKHKLLTLNLMRCEAHHEILKKILNK